MENIYVGRIASLRALMASRGWDAVILTGSDPHSSEYPAARWKQVLWLTGFTGECGDVVVTAGHAGLWTDTRYFIQADSQLAGTGVQLHKMRVPGQIPIPQWLAMQEWGPDGPVIAVDGLCQSVSAIDNLKAAFRGPVRVEAVPDLMEGLWEGRPPLPETPVITLGDDLTGESREKRLRDLRKQLVVEGADAILLTALDETAWVLNARGSDVEYNPVIISYLLVTLDDAWWFVRKSDDSRDGETESSFEEIAADGIAIDRYDNVDAVLGTLGDRGVGSILVDPSTLNVHLLEVLEGARVDVVRKVSPVPMWKAVKNPVEIEGFRDAHIEDGLAVEKFLYWVEGNVGRIDEWEAACHLQSLRAEIPGYRGDSFETISAYGPGAALPHYVTPRVGAPVLEPRGLYLCDSGGQYMYGTTDITRTTPLGPCTELEKEDYTLVLKCHIDLSMAVFPEGTCGPHLDILARNPLWQAKRNFGHGTGHGVGFFLNVHEGPHEFRQNFNDIPFRPGMIVTDEPGMYREGMHGVRHENVLLCRSLGESEFGKWYGFEPLTLCHIDTSIVVKDLLTPEEKAWLNAYNERVYRTLSPRLPAETAAWLREKTLPVD